MSHPRSGFAAPPRGGDASGPAKPDPRRPLDVPNTAIAAHPPARRWPAWLRRGRMEIAACIVIALGIAMMLQPFAMVLFTWSFLTTLAGTAMFMVVSKFPE
jgi:hypothetical protein